MSPSAKRSRLKAVPSVEPEIAPPKWLSSRRRRIGTYVVVGAAVLGVLTPLVLWMHYRATYVVSRNAQVKGQIADVGAQLSGVVKSVEVDDGQHVEAGQVLVRFEAEHLRAQREKAQSQLDKATNELEVERLAIEQERRRLANVVTEAGARSAAAKSQVEAATSRADDARNRFQLRQSLAKEGIITQEELSTADATRRTADAMGETAKAEQRAAEATRRLAEVESEGLSVREQHLTVLGSEIAGYRAELALAEADMKASVIVAPTEGRVVRRIVEPGASVVVGQPIISLWLGKDVWIEAWIDEDELGQVQVGNATRASLKPYPRRVFTGVVESIGVSTDYELPDTAVPQPRNSRMSIAPVVNVRIRLDDPQGLFPGLSAVVGIRKHKKFFAPHNGAMEDSKAPATK